MADVTLFTSPMARKKRVDCRYKPNSYRIISHEAETWSRPEKVSTYTTKVDMNVLGQKAEPSVPFIDHRNNRPNPNHVGFLRQDVRLLNDPVCDVYTESTKQEQINWWPSRASEEPLKKPAHTLDTTVRDDFQFRGKGTKINGRHTANPNKVPANGTVPVNLLRNKSGKQRFWKEGISYEHQYNSRLEPQYPSRGKRHGSFVWDQFAPQEVDRMLHHYGVVADKRQQTCAKSAASPKICQEEGINQASPSKSAHPAVRKLSETSGAENSVKPTEQPQSCDAKNSSNQGPTQSPGVKFPPIAM